MTQAASDSLPPGTLVQGRYEIVAVVGQGGLGTVYRVVDVLFGRSNVYALKEQWDQSQSARKQFAREGAWLKALSHPNIPKVLDYFDWDQRLYLVMNFVEGENLDRKLAQVGQRPLPEAQVIGWVLPICDALHYLHTRTPPIIHRDVKPSNIIVTPAGHSVLVDLGIAKEHAPGANATATFVRKAGTEGYAPPEQYAAAGLAGPWSDVYGVGATLYQLLTARIPPTAVERVALDAPLRPPRELNPSVTQSTNAAVLHALAIRPSDRFQSIQEFKRALTAPLNAPAGVPPAPAVRAATPAHPDARRVSLAHMAATFQPARMSSSPSMAPPRAAPPARVRRRQAGAATQDDGADEAPSERQHQPRVARAALVWSALALVVVAVTALALIQLTRAFVPLDRSTPQASVQGYYAALAAQDYARAWQYTAESTKDQTSQAPFITSQRTDDARTGRVRSATIVAIVTDSQGHATGTVMVVRSSSPVSVGTDTIVLTEYGSVWLIDNVSSG